MVLGVWQRRCNGRLSCGLAAAVGLWLATLSAAAPGHADVAGDAVALSGDTLEVGGQRIKLDGIIAPVEGQICRQNGRPYDCHRIATTALMDLTAGMRIRCVPLHTRFDHVLVATCFAAGYDLSEGMAYTGWALGDPKSGGRYRRFEAQARRHKHGLWRGDFVPPWQWKKSQRSD